MKVWAGRASNAGHSASQEALYNNQFDVSHSERQRNHTRMSSGDDISGAFSHDDSETTERFGVSIAAFESPFCEKNNSPIQMPVNVAIDSVRYILR